MRTRWPAAISRRAKSRANRPSVQLRGIGGFAHTPISRSPLGQDHRRQPDRHLPHPPRRAARDDRAGRCHHDTFDRRVIGQPYSAAYCASKGGVKMLTKALAVEYMARGRPGNAVSPG